MNIVRTFVRFCISATELHTHDQLIPSVFISGQSRCFTVKQNVLQSASWRLLFLPLFSTGCLHQSRHGSAAGHDPAKILLQHPQPHLHMALYLEPYHLHMALPNSILEHLAVANLSSPAYGPQQPLPIAKSLL